MNISWQEASQILRKAGKNLWNAGKNLWIAGKNFFLPASNMKFFCEMPIKFFPRVLSNAELSGVVRFGHPDFFSGCPGPWSSLQSETCKICPPRYLEICTVKNSKKILSGLIFAVDSKYFIFIVRRVRNRTEPESEIFVVFHQTALSRNRYRENSPKKFSTIHFRRKL